MFNLFQKKGDTVKVIDKIWMSESAKWNGLLAEWKKDNALIMICWFEETARQLQSIFDRETTTPVSIFIVRQTHSSQIADKPILFAEHYPLLHKEHETFQQWGLQKVIIHSALDEPLFDHFGGAKIIQLMKQMGMKEDACAEHKLISNSIEKAQEKIEKKVAVEQSALSQKEWMERNL